MIKVGETYDIPECRVRVLNYDVVTDSVTLQENGGRTFQMNGPDFHRAIEVHSSSIGGELKEAPFEELRKYLSRAMDQLLLDLEAQSGNYMVPHNDVVALIEDVAKLQGVSPLTVWETWALRHAIPVHKLVKMLASRDSPRYGDTSEVQGDLCVLEKRLRDLLGYAVLGLILVERELSAPSNF